MKPLSASASSGGGLSGMGRAKGTRTTAQPLSHPCRRRHALNGRRCPTSSAARDQAAWRSTERA